MTVTEEIVWLIMSKDRKFVAKGTVRNRCLVAVDSSDKKRFLTYTSKAKAENGFKLSGFYGMEQLGFKYGDDISDYLEAVEAKLTITL